MKTIVTGLLVLLLPLWVAAADKNEVRVVDAWARAVPAVAPVAGGFLTVVNMGNATDRLQRSAPSLSPHPSRLSRTNSIPISITRS